MILLNPGPVKLSDSVRHAMSGPDLCHREPEFSEMQERIREELLDVYDLPHHEWASALLPGSGTAAVEAMISSLVPENGKLLVLENGVYGERMTRIARNHRIAVSHLTYAWGSAISEKEVERALRADQKISHLAMVHHETTTGRLNNLENIAAICKDQGVYFMVDTVSSFGAEAIEFKKWSVAACAGTAGKCLHGAPGLCFVVLRRDGIPPPDALKRTLYLDLQTHCHLQDLHTTMFTQPVHLYYALDQALSELKMQSGWQARRKQYELLADRVYDGLVALGIEPYLAREESSVVLRSYKIPEEMTYRMLHDGLKKRGFIIYSGQGDFEKKIFRISTMGEITEPDIDRLLIAVGDILTKKSHTAFTMPKE